MFGKKTWAEVGRGEERKGGKTPAHSSLFIIADIHFFYKRAEAGSKEDFTAAHIFLLFAINFYVPI